MYLGIDIGSVAVKVVVLDQDLKVKETQYVRSHGQPFETTLSVLKDVFTRHNPEYIEFIAATGTGGFRTVRLSVLRLELIEVRVDLPLGAPREVHELVRLER